MKPSTLILPQTLLPGRLRSLLLLLVCVSFTAFGVFMASRGQRIGYVNLVLFGSGCVIFIVNLNPRASYLKLENESFTYCALFRAHTVRWDDVAGFGTVRIGLNNMVAWNFGPNHLRKVVLRDMNRSLCGFDAGLPNTFGMKAEDLAVLMEMLRQRHIANSLEMPQA